MLQDRCCIGGDVVADGVGLIETAEVAATTLVEHLRAHPLDAARYLHLRRTAGRFRPSQVRLQVWEMSYCEGRNRPAVRRRCR